MRLADSSPTSPETTLAATWPGRGADGTVVLPLPSAWWPPPLAGGVHAGVAFAPKHELHVTLVGRALGAQLRDALAEPALADAFARAAPWRVRRTGWRWQLHKPVDGPKPARGSIIEALALPAMARFHNGLQRACGSSWPLPPPHVTLFVHGDAEGIGVPDRATLAALRVGEPWRVR